MTLVLLARYWREISIGVLVALLGALIAVSSVKLAHRTNERDAALAALEKTKTDYRVAQAQATASNIAHVRDVEAANAATTKDTEDDLTKKLADARSAGAAYAAKLRNQTAAPCRATRGTGVPETADATGSASGTSSPTLLDDDIAICSANTVKAQGWQDWYAGLK